jgi:hypothetical protein
MRNIHEFYFYFLIGDNRCRYQGVYHPYINQCICAPGYYGDECQYSKSKRISIKKNILFLF